MSLQAVRRFLPVVFCAMPALGFGQLNCPSPMGIVVGVLPTDIAPGQPFTIGAQVCSSPSSGVPVLFTAPDPSTGAPLAVTQTTDANGLAAIYVGSGLPASPYAYQFKASTNPPVGGPGGSIADGTVYVGGGPISSALKGKYAFLLQGITGVTPTGAGLKAAVAGTFVADGQGGITSGEVDVNSSAGVQTQVPVTGRYTLFSYENIGGTLTLQIGGNSYSGTLNLGGSQKVGSVYQGGGLSFSQGVIGSGSFALQGSYPPGGNQIAGEGTAIMSGETACTASCVQGGGSAEPITAQFRVGFGSQIQDGPVGGDYPVFLFGTETVGITSKPYFDYGVSAGKDSSGRELIGSDYVVYVVDATHAYMLSLKPHSTSDLLSGPITVTQAPQ